MLEVPDRPLIGGHEGVGIIFVLGTATGSRNGTDGFAVGDVVGIAWRGRVCAIYDARQHGEENHCFNQQVTGLHRDGTCQGTNVFRGQLLN